MKCLIAAHGGKTPMDSAFAVVPSVRGTFHGSVFALKLVGAKLRLCVLAAIATLHAEVPEEVQAGECLMDSR
jgi:hypothetical protein